MTDFLRQLNWLTLEVWRASGLSVARHFHEENFASAELIQPKKAGDEVLQPRLMQIPRPAVH
jgi:hypothetical protein